MWLLKDQIPVASWGFDSPGLFFEYVICIFPGHPPLQQSLLPRLKSSTDLLENR